MSKIAILPSASSFARESFQHGSNSSTFDQYHCMKEQLILPKSISLYFNCLQRSYFATGKDSDHQLKSDTSTFQHFQHYSFCKSFATLNKTQKLEYMQGVVKQLTNSLKVKARLKPKDSQQESKEVLARMRCYLCSIPYWDFIILKIKKRKLTIIHKSKILDLYLRQYLIRKSTTHPFAFVLQNIGYPLSKQLQVIHISLEDRESENHFQEIYTSIQRVIIEIQSERLHKEIYQQSRKVKMSDRQLSEKKIFMFVNEKQRNRLNQFVKSGGICGIADEKISSGISQLRKIKEKHQNSRNELQSLHQEQNLQIFRDHNAVYHCTMSIPFPVKLQKLGLFQIYPNNHRHIFRLKTIEHYEQTISHKGEVSYLALYQKINCKQNIYGQMLSAKTENLVQMEESQSGFGKYDKLITLLNIDHPQNASFIDSMQIHIKSSYYQSKDQPLSDLTIHAKFMQNTQFSQQFILSFFKEFKDMFDRINRQNLRRGNKNDDLYAIFTDSQKQYEEEDMEDDQKHNRKLTKKDYDLQMENYLNSDGSKKAVKLQRTQEQKIKFKEYLKRHHSMVPTKQKIGVLMKESALANDWKRAKDGGLVCINEELVDRQKRLYKICLKKFGQTLLKGKNIINFSLPVIVFKKQSHLASLAKTYLYAPIHIQKAAREPNPLERMKHSIIILMSGNIMALNMEKPFNPILGQTYQGYIDGCPMYLQQISHHPPISSYYFVGRGYKMYGTIEPKISIGLNSASGYSPRPHFVQFDDGCIIQVVYARIQIGGMLFGERTFNYIGKVYAYDRKNRYFAQVSFGPIHQGIFTSSSEPQDYFHGYIYEVTAEFQAYFDKKSEKRYPDKEHIINKLTFFDGIWNSTVNVNGEEYINFKVDLPYEFVEEQYPLQSDSRYREDLTWLRKGDLQSAQDAKERMQDIQRNDRKLRQQYQKSVKK